VVDRAEKPPSHSHIISVFSCAGRVKMQGEREGGDPHFGPQKEVYARVFLGLAAVKCRESREQDVHSPGGYILQQFLERCYVLSPRQTRHNALDVTCVVWCKRAMDCKCVLLACKLLVYPPKTARYFSVDILLLWGEHYSYMCAHMNVRDVGLWSTHVRWGFRGGLESMLC
jgi:hypothetical protein